MVVQSGLWWTWSKTPQKRFSRDAGHLLFQWEAIPSLFWYPAMYQSWVGCYCSWLSNTGCKYTLQCTKVRLAAIALGCPTPAVSTILISYNVPKLGWCYCSGLSNTGCKYYFDILQCTKVRLAAIALGCPTPAFSTILISCNVPKLGWLLLLWVVQHRL